MVLRLLLDTTHDALMLAIAEDESILFRDNQISESRRYHSAILLPRIQSALAETGHKIADLEGLAVNWGPGSFTGIRTGLTVARLMGQFTEVTTYGLNTFELLAGHQPYRNRKVTILLNAFRQQHYRAQLNVNDKGSVDWREAPQVYPNDVIPNSTADVYLLEGSLRDKLAPNALEMMSLEDNPVFTPEVMAFYLHHNPQQYLQPWQEIRPLYLQLPHITIPTQRAVSK